MAFIGSWEPHFSLKLLTTSYCLISKAMHGPYARALAIKLNSGTTFLYIKFKYIKSIYFKRLYI